ncbi:hypothetical protein BaOVIS_013410 [Babesia ovis]|uniref:Uncharacterized protein n=1 Tax=Babesia ovis TaxID=5869 RepID=A0A9W5WV47_BABOV|nr:hypothetical protein BaOVIS_013410 [Babesia ovis]
MAELRRVTGAKLLITKALLHKRDKPWTYDGYSSVADLPRLLEKSERLATFCSYMYSTVCMVLHFIEKDKSTVAILAEPGYEVYVAGDPSGCIRVKVPLSTEYRPLEGNTYILTDAALLVTRGMLHIKAIGGTRLLPCHNSDLHVLRSNDISRNYTCELTRNDGIVPPMAP